MGITNVTLPARSMRKKALGANGASDVSVSRISPRVGRPKPSNTPPPMALVAVRKCRRFISRLRFRDAGSLLDGSANTRIGAAAADVAGHGAVDVGIARLGVCGEQRARRHDLPRLTVPALRHVEREPGRLDFLAGRRGADGFDGRDALADRGRDRRDARARRLSVDLDSACAAEARVRRAGKGSSDSSIPSVKAVGKNTSAFWAVSLSATTEVTLIVPISIVRRSSGQTSDASLVGSPALASCTTRRNLTGPFARRLLSSSERKFGDMAFASSSLRSRRAARGRNW